MTDRPQFQAASTAETLRQVVEQDPVSPRQLNPSLPRDLETLCLKCLEKEPSRRFPTAADLAQELHRFLHGEPIQSRPITQSERARKLCQRNPAVASLSAAVDLVLLTGSAVSLFFAFQSEARNRNLLKETKRANAKADEARLNLYDAHMNLAQSNWEDSRVGAVVELLDRYRSPASAEKDLRGFEWFYWDRLCNSYLLELKGHTSWVEGGASPPSAWPANRASDQPHVSHTRTKHGAAQPLRRNQRGLWANSNAQPSLPAGAATPGNNNKETLTLKGHNAYVTSVAFSADGKRLASASDDETVKVWDTRTWTPELRAVVMSIRKGASVRR